MSVAQRVEIEGMNDTHEKLLNAILERGQVFISETLNETLTETKRKLQGEHGFKLAQTAALFDALGIQIATADDVVISKAEYQSLLVQSHDAISSKLGTLDGKERRK